MRSAPRARSAGGKFQPCVRTRANSLRWPPFLGGRPASTQPACGPPGNLARATRPSKLFLTQFIEYVELFLLTRSAGPGIGRSARDTAEALLAAYLFPRFLFRSRAIASSPPAPFCAGANAPI